MAIDFIFGVRYIISMLYSGLSFYKISGDTELKFNCGIVEFRQYSDIFHFGIFELQM